MYRFLACVATAITLLSPCLTSAETGSAPAPASAVSSTPAVPAEKATSPATTEKRFRVGYVDIMKIAGESNAGKVAKSHFEAKADRYKTQIETKQKLLEKQKADLEAKLPTYKPEQRAAKIKAYEKKVDELRKMLQKADQEMRPMQEELTKEIYAKIESAARGYGTVNGFSAIVEKRELLYLGKEIDAEDVTEALIKELDKQ
jgi:outer membrane protein